MINNQNLSEILNEIKVKEIKSIVIRTVGLIDVFGKMIIDIEFINGNKQSIEIPSPVPTDIITDWLDTNTLINRTIMYEF